jgi:hypothetical protein
VLAVRGYTYVLLVRSFRPKIECASVITGTFDSSHDLPYYIVIHCVYIIVI